MHGTCFPGVYALFLGSSLSLPQPITPPNAPPMSLRHSLLGLRARTIHIAPVVGTLFDSAHCNEAFTTIYLILNVTPPSIMSNVLIMVSRS